MCWDILQAFLRHQKHAGKGRLTMGKIGDFFHVDKLVLYNEAVLCRGGTFHTFLTSTIRKGEWSSRSDRVLSWDRAPCTHWIEECMDHRAMEKRFILCPYRETNRFRRSFIPDVHFKLRFKKPSQFVTKLLRGHLAPYKDVSYDALWCLNTFPLLASFPILYSRYRINSLSM
jgi:hypothetical protein